MTLAAVALALGFFLGAFTVHLIHRRPRHTEGRHRCTVIYSPAARGYRDNQ